jgi:hypothetical protein
MNTELRVMSHYNVILFTAEATHKTEWREY